MSAPKMDVDGPHGPGEQAAPASAPAPELVPAKGRLFVVTGSATSRRLDVARAVADRLGECVLVDGDAVGAMSRGPLAATAPGGGERLRAVLLRWSACIAVAETYQLEGVDAVITDVVLGDDVEDFLDLLAPEPLHLVVVDDGEAAGTPPWGLWLTVPDGGADDAAAEVLERVEQSLVTTGT